MFPFFLFDWLLWRGKKKIPSRSDEKWERVLSVKYHRWRVAIFWVLLASLQAFYQSALFAGCFWALPVCLKQDKLQRGGKKSIPQSVAAQPWLCVHAGVTSWARGQEGKGGKPVEGKGEKKTKEGRQWEGWRGCFCSCLAMPWTAVVVPRGSSVGAMSL